MPSGCENGHTLCVILLSCPVLVCCVLTAHIVRREWTGMGVVVSAACICCKYKHLCLFDIVLQGLLRMVRPSASLWSCCGACVMVWYMCVRPGRTALTEAALAVTSSLSKARQAVHSTAGKWSHPSLCLLVCLHQSMHHLSCGLAAEAVSCR